MKIHRFIVNFDLSKKELEIKDKELINQIKNVLRLKQGEFIELCDGKSISAMTEIVEIGKDIIKVKVSAPLRSSSFAGQNSTKKVNLFCAILKKENFEMVVQKTTECGVSKIIPIITSRTIKTGLNLERLRKIAKEASEQSGRINVPEILEPISFEKSLELAKEKDLNILFDASGELSLKTHGYFSAEKFLVLAPSRSQGILKDNSPFVNLFIGPEGGWTKSEIEKAKSLNFKIVSLGSLTLRGETAAIIATYLISNLK